VVTIVGSVPMMRVPTAAAGHRHPHRMRLVVGALLLHVVRG
jgi:hypothetical protein